MEVGTAHMGKMSVRGNWVNMTMKGQTSATDRLQDGRLWSCSDDVKVTLRHRVALLGGRGVRLEVTI